MNNTTKECWEYWKTCKEWWMNWKGDSEQDAIAKAYWYDCRETWDMDNSWNEAKRDFAYAFSIAFPHCHYPDER